ncbi:MAG TPA: porin [Planctomycetota bacterium]|nr:porin [Planctomycetota bacterium]
MSRAASTVDDLKREVEKLRKEINQRQDSKASPISRVDAVTGGKYGPGSAVETRSGKLQMSGLLQVWYQSVQNDNIGNVEAGVGANALDFSESNEIQDNDTFRIRRSELKFAIDIHENISAVVMIDPTREHNIGFYPLPTQSRHDAVFGNASFIQTGSGRQGGNTIIPSLLQDAYINYHGVIPHHDFTIGQFIPPAGEEAWRGNGYLDFVERSLATGINKVRDIGVMVHGTWLENRVQYWVGAFNGAQSMLVDPEIDESGNRSDENDEKDFAWRIAVRPVWSTECWYGRLELGVHRTDGIRGEAGSNTDSSRTINGLNREQTSAHRQGAWAWYRPNGPVRGMWARGEVTQVHDRNLSTGILGLGGSDFGLQQANPGAIDVFGFYAAVGYKLSESRWADCLKDGGALKNALYNMEFAFRYEKYENVFAEDLVNPDRNTDVFGTRVMTAGLNYYIKGYDAKIQANYLFVRDPDSPKRGLRDVNNDVFVVNFQVMF